MTIASIVKPNWLAYEVEGVGFRPNVHRGRLQPGTLHISYTH